MRDTLVGRFEKKSAEIYSFFSRVKIPKETGQIDVEFLRVFFK